MMAPRSAGQRGGFVVGASVGMAALADWLFFGQVVGWTAGLFAVAAMTAVLAHAPEALRRRAVVAASFAGLGLAGTLVIEPTTLSVLLAVLAVMLLAALTVGRWTPSVTAWGRQLLGVVLAALARVALDSWLAQRWYARRPRARPRVVRGMLLWVVPLLLGGVFVLLFTAANPVLEAWARQVSAALRRWSDWLAVFSFARLLLWLVVFWGTWGLLRPLRSRLRHWLRVPPVRMPGAAWETSMVVRCLVVFNAVFAVQTVLDVRYLWYRAALPTGLTYATYAQRGAYPLVATALLAALFVVVTFRRGGAGERRAARGLVYAWIGQNVFLMASAMWRLKLYVAVYSLTYWRVAAGVWMVLVALGFGWTVWKIVAGRDNAWLLRANVGTAAAVLYALAFVNVGGLIATFNVRHCREVAGAGVPLDLVYLRELGPVALPALEEAAQRLPVPGRWDAQTKAEVVRDELAGQLADWRGWTLRRAWLRQRAAATRERLASMEGGG